MSINGDPTCPCLGEMTHKDSPKSHNDTCFDVQIASKSTKALTTYCFPPSYGTHCASHDMGLAPFCNNPNNLEHFCNAPFCFIDPTKCKLSENNTYAQSAFFPNLYYSYNTCGSDMDWRVPITDQLKGATLRVGIPVLFYPEHFKLDANGNAILWSTNVNDGVGDFRGIYIEILNLIASKGGFTVQYQSVSANALKTSGDGWQACVQDVGQGILDMCVGAFWETVTRREKVAFTTALFNNVFYMRVPPPQEDDDFGDKIQVIFRPFTTTLWITIVFATICVGLSYTILCANKQTSMNEIPEKIIASLYVATMELMNGANQNEDKPIYHKSITVTWSFFVLIMVAAYTANLAAFLGQTRVKHKITSVEDCIVKDGNFCHHASDSIRQTIQRKYKSLHHTKEFSFDDEEDVPKALLNGTCDIFVTSKYTWDIDDKYWGQCETMWLGDFVFSFKVGWPVSQAVLEPLTYWLGRGVEAGALEEALRKFAPMPRCVQPTTVVTSTTKPIGVESMTAPLLLLGAGIGFGMIYKGAKRSKKYLEREKENPAESL